MPASLRAQVLGLLGLLSVVARGGAQDSLPSAEARLVSRSHHPIRDAFHNDPLVQPIPLVDGVKVISMPSCGVGNRLRQINGAVNFAKTIGAPLEIHWSEKMAHCNGMSFEDLFDLDPFLTNLWNISVVPKPTSTAGLKEMNRFGPSMPFKIIPGATYCGCDCNGRCSWKRADYLAGPGDASAAAGPGKPGQGRGHPAAAKAKKKQRTLVTWGCTHCPPEARVVNELAALHHEMCVEHLAMYRPSRSVRSSLAALDVDWDRVAGVHVRQGDKTQSVARAVKSGCKNKAIADIYAASMKQLLARDKSITTFYVASDNSKVVLALTQQFPRGMVLSVNDVLHEEEQHGCTRPLSLDLWALASAKTILGSPGSTFGYLAAALGNPTPLVYPKLCSGNLTHPHFPDDVDVDPVTHMDRLSDYTHRVFCTAGGVTDEPCKKLR